MDIPDKNKAIAICTLFFVIFGCFWFSCGSKELSEEEIIKLSDKNTSEEKYSKVIEEITAICQPILEENFINVSLKDDGKTVFVLSNIQESFLKRTTRKNSIKTAKEIFEALYNSNLPIESVTFLVIGETIDNYGQVRRPPFFKFTLRKKTADKIVWKNIGTLIEYDNFAEILDEAVVDSKYKKWW